MLTEKIMLMPKNSVQLQQWIDSQLDVFSNLWHNLSMTRSKLKPLESLERIAGIFGLVLGIKEAIGFIQAVELNWNFKIGNQTVQIIPVVENNTTAVSLIQPQKGESGGIFVAITSLFLFVSLSNWCWILKWCCSGDGWEVDVLWCQPIKLIQVVSTS